MADVFLSYARGDRSSAERLATAIRETGLTVWWDRHIKGGAEFSRDIERQLDEASKVLVLWSREAVGSRWVRDEASVAADSGRLVSATLDGTVPPLGFRQFQTIDLKGWAAKGAVIPAELAEALEVESPATTRPRSPAPRRRLIAVCVGALLLAGAATVAIVRPAPVDRLFSAESQSEGVSLAIMPFVTQGAGGNDYLGAGLSSALADRLAPLSGLRITASTSTQAIAGKGLTAPDIARRLGITHLVEGNVQQTGDRYTISVRLIDARTSEQRWARQFEGKADELQSLESRMARELAGGLIARLRVGQGELAKRADVNPAAYEAYLRALERVSVRDNDEARLEAIKQFRLAASMQPDFADAHAGYSYLLALTGHDVLGMTPNELIAAQRRAAARALQLDPNNALALVAQAAGAQNFYGEVERPVAITQKVLSRSPNFVPAHYSHAVGLLMAGRTRAALDHIEQAMDLDPFDNLLRIYRVKILYALGDYEAVRIAAQACRDACESMTYQWFIALAGFGTPEQYRRDFPLVAERARAEGVPAANLADARGIAGALILARSYEPRTMADASDPDYPSAAIAARLINFDRGLRYARAAADRRHADSALDLLNEGRVTFTPEQRADPRYHQLFRHPKLVRIAALRRKRGVSAGLPLSPVKPYTGR